MFLNFCLIKKFSGKSRFTDVHDEKVIVTFVVCCAGGGEQLEVFIETGRDVTVSCMGTQNKHLCMLWIDLQMTTADTKWKLEGDYFEGCNCDSICPCIFMGDPDKGDCQATVAWHIQKGQYGQTKLDGLNVAGVFHTPGNMWTGPKWKAALYLDERASSEQADALDKIFSGQAGGFFAKVGSLIGEVLGVRPAPIQFGVDGKRRWLRIPNSLELEIEGMTGSDPNKESLVINPAITVAPGFDPVISHSTKYSYHDHGLEWDNSGRNAFYSKFSYTP